MIITSQLAVRKWVEVIGEKTITGVILDRIVHDAQRIGFKGESMRKKENFRSRIKPMNKTLLNNYF
jgi:DNA replication protein DnaC